MPEFPIDAVIAWVDGNDPVHKAKRYKYSHNGEEMKYEDVASDVRFTDDGEIKYCVASLLKFAPWLRTIYIITDNPDPKLDGFADKYFPDRTTQLKIVDHKDACRGGYEHCLPVFNSNSVETMVWRIPGLSEHYIYLNDDFFLVRPVQSEDFFTDGKMVIYVRPYSTRKLQIRRFLLSLLPWHQRVSWKYAMMNSARMMGRKMFPRLGHTPHAQMKSLFAEYYAGHEELFVRNLDCRFREMHQYNPQILNFMLAQQKGLAIERPLRQYALYVMPKPHRKQGYLQEKLEEIDRKSNAPFCCFNSLDRGTEEDKKLAFDWIRRRLGIA